MNKVFQGQSFRQNLLPTIGAEMFILFDAVVTILTFFLFVLRIFIHSLSKLIAACLRSIDRTKVHNQGLEWLFSDL